MSNTANKIAAGIATLFLSSLSGGESQAAGWTPELTISSAFVEGNTDLVVVYTTNGTGYTTGCVANAWIFVADTDARRGRAYATILAAIASGKKIQLWYGDTCAAWSYHSASSVRLVQ